MLSIEDAINRIYEEFPSKRIVSCVDIGDLYLFRTINRTLRPTVFLELPIGCYLESVHKTNGKISFVNLMDISGSEKTTIVDVSPYLNSEDSEFYKLYNEIFVERRD